MKSQRRKDQHENELMLLPDSRKESKVIHSNKSPTVLDLFAGAGGLSEGFIRAGCSLIGHIEMDASACDTLVTRMVYHELVKRGRMDDYKKYVCGSVSMTQLIEKHSLYEQRDSVIRAAISKDNVNALIADIKKKLNGRNLDFVIGGPPCQAYSHIGRARDKNNMRHDKRNFLYKRYVDFLKALEPKIFVFENVLGLLSAAKGHHLREMRKLMHRAGYKTDLRVVHANTHGVPQNRKRIILIGWSEQSTMLAYPDFPEVAVNSTIAELFSDLPSLKAGEEAPVQSLVKNPILDAFRISNAKFGLLTDHVTRPHGLRDLQIYKLAVKAKQKGQNIKYPDLPKKLRTHQNQTAFLDRFKVVDGGAKHSHTVVAHISKDGHYYIHPDIRQNRSLSVREAARLQTFPDDYKFEGNRGAKFKQIGNAVPPLLSEVIARTLVRYI